MYDVVRFSFSLLSPPLFFDKINKKRAVLGRNQNVFKAICLDLTECTPSGAQIDL